MGQIAAAGIDAAATTAAASMSLKGQLDANNKNLIGVRETNETNERLAQEQRDWDFDMWNRNNEYNSPAEQVKRLEAAGLNPLMAFGSSGIANTSAQSAGGQTPATAIAPHVDNAFAGASPLFASAMRNYATTIKDIASAKKDQADTNLISFQYDSIKESALKGMNPYEIQIMAANEVYKDSHTRNKYLDDSLALDIRRNLSAARISEITEKERTEYVNLLKEQVKGLGITNKFSEQKAIQELDYLKKEIEKIMQETKDNHNVALAQINAANASASHSSAAAGLAQEQTNIAKQDVIKQTFYNSFRKMGIDPEHADMPFFAGMALKYFNGELTRSQVSQFWKNCALVEKSGTKELVKHGGDLTRFSLEQNQSGLFGSGISWDKMRLEFNNLLNGLGLE